ncbi:unannotated protein [freshwater metagenome]|uniref:Unannotated protein n=1 Tax=freshwater metagenome TaxID=449393 RepID=A0A6J6YZK7_9ZZZZ
MHPGEALVELRTEELVRLDTGRRALTEQLVNQGLYTLLVCGHGGGDVGRGHGLRLLTGAAFVTVRARFRGRNPIS